MTFKIQAGFWDKWDGEGEPTGTVGWEDEPNGGGFTTREDAEAGRAVVLPVVRLLGNVVRGNGGGVILASRCAHCGVRRVTDTWAQRPDTGEQGLMSVSYETAEEKES